MCLQEVCKGNVFQEEIIKANVVRVGHQNTHHLPCSGNLWSLPKGKTISEKQQALRRVSMISQDCVEGTVALDHFLREASEQCRHQVQQSAAVCPHHYLPWG